MISPNQSTSTRSSGVLDTLEVDAVTFQWLQEKSLEEVQALLNDSESISNELQRKSIKLLGEMQRLASESMESMNQQYPGLPPDTLETTLDLVTRDGASVVVLQGRKDPTRREAPIELLGYGIVIRGIENFPEHNHQDPARQIPPMLLNDDKTKHRVIRLFVDDVAREQERPGFAFGLIIDKVKQLSADGKIIGMVLTDIDMLTPSEQTYSDSGKQIWLEARTALVKRGFESSGLGTNEVVAHEDGTIVRIPFEWWVFPPETEQGVRLYESQLGRSRDLAAEQMSRLAGMIASLPTSGADVIHIGSGRDAFDISVATGSQVVSLPITNSEPRSNRYGRRPNLTTIPDWCGLSMPDDSVEAVILNGALPEIELKELFDPSDPTEEQTLKGFIENRIKALKEGGTLLIRDTIAPDERSPVHLYLNQTESLPDCSNRTLVELFEEFVSTRSESCVREEEWLNVVRMSDAGNLAVYQAPKPIVAEFLLKYRYSKHWQRERQRPYTTQSADERLKMIQDLGLRLLYAAPEYNSFQRERNQAAGIRVSPTYSTEELILPTNHLVVAQRVKPTDGVGFRIGATKPNPEDPFLSVNVYEQRDASGNLIAVRDVVRRPYKTLDIIPYRIEKGRLYVWGRIYPRPIITLNKSIDGSLHGGYTTEQLAVIVEPNKLEGQDALSNVVRQSLAKIKEDYGSILTTLRSTEYLVQPDTFDEVVSSVAVKDDQLPLDDITVSQATPFGSDYTVRAFDSVRILQGIQTGQVMDARLERKIYELMHTFRLNPGPWIGTRLHLLEQERGQLDVSDGSSLLKVPQRNAFERREAEEPRFLSVTRRCFSEMRAGLENPESEPQRELECVALQESTGMSHEMLSVLPVVKTKNEDGVSQVLVGIVEIDVPSAQEQFGTSALKTIPTVRIPKAVATMPEAYRHASAFMEARYGMQMRMMTPLGGKFASSPGICADLIHPMVGEVVLKNSNMRDVTWVPLSEVVPLIPQLKCGQLITALYRLAHTTGGVFREGPA